MLQSISINYKGKPITIEDILKQAKFLRRLKFPFVGTFIVIFLLDIVKAVTKQHGITTVPSAILAAVAAFAWLLCVLGFLIYGRRIVQLLPNKYSTKVKRLTVQLTGLSVSFKTSVGYSIGDLVAIL
jgi:hypothetical protein